MRSGGDRKNILITGRPRVGKTTLIKHLVALLGDRAGGFYTEEIAGEGVRGRSGFRITTLDGEEGVLAAVGCESPCMVGRYGVNLRDLEDVGAAAIERAIREKVWIVVDEIGKMEEFSARFKGAIMAALASERRVLATIRLHDSPFAREIKSRPDVELIGLTVPDRDAIRQLLEQKVGER